MNDQHQEYIDHATRAAFTGEASPETRGPGAAIRARIGAQVLRAVAAEAERIDALAEMPNGDLTPEGWREFRDSPWRWLPRLDVARQLRAEADRLENNTKEN